MYPYILPEQRAADFYMLCFNFHSLKIFCDIPFEFFFDTWLI